MQEFLFISNANSHPRGRLLLPIFERATDPNQFPDYRDAIKNPITGDEIRNKIKKRQYPDFDSFINDMKLFFDNARLYNTHTFDVIGESDILLKIMSDEIEDVRQMNDRELFLTNLDTMNKPIVGGTRIPVQSHQYNGESYVIGMSIPIS